MIPEKCWINVRQRGNPRFERKYWHYRAELFPFLIGLVVFLATTSHAQEMEARAYSRAPVGSQFLLVSYAFQSGDVLLDPTLPLRDVSVKFSLASVGYGRTFNLGGRQASLAVVVPYIRGTAKGTVFENALEVRRSGLGDVRVRFATGLIGGPAMTPKEFAAHKPKTLLGVSLTMVVPTGQYDPNRLVNPGSNRFALKPEIGMSMPLQKWTVELAAGVWMFAPNNNFLSGSRREQKPLSSLQTHVIYTLRPRMWIAASATYYNGGRTVIDRVVNADVQSNSRIGAAFSLPMSQRHSLKVAWARGMTARIGGDLNTIAVGWQYNWLR